MDLMIFCARATRGLRRPSLGLMARLGVPVGGRVRRRTQCKINQPPSLKRYERAWKDHLKSRSTAARRPTGMPFQERKTSKIGKGSSKIAGMVSALAEHPR